MVKVISDLYYVISNTFLTSEGTILKVLHNIQQIIIDFIRN